MLAQPLAQRLNTDGARALRDEIPFMKQHQGWNASNVETAGQRRFRLCVNFQEAKFRLELAGDTLESRSHRLAGPAPLRPEIDHNRNIVALDVGVEAAGGNRRAPTPPMSAGGGQLSSITKRTTRRHATPRTRNGHVEHSS